MSSVARVRRALKEENLEEVRALLNHTDRLGLNLSQGAQFVVHQMGVKGE
jgi:hypothetical protein